MLRTECSFCDHANPAGSKFCNACGGPLHLTSCPNCDALNDVTASVCHKCETALASRPASFALASSAARATSESHAPDDHAEPIVQGAARERALAGSYAAEADAPEPDYAAHTSTTPSDFAFTGSHWRPALADPTLPRNRIMIAVLSFIGIVCVALSAYLYWGTDMAERSSTSPKAPPPGVESRAQDRGPTTRGDLERGTAQGRTNAAAPLTARSGADVASPVNSHAVEPGKPLSTTTQSCTEIVDALGLCPPQAVQRR